MVAMKRRQLLQAGAALGLVAPLSLFAAPAIDEGFDYKRIQPALPLPHGDKPEVLEIFWYGCPHCYQMQPLLEAWRTRHGKDIAFHRMPAVLGESWVLHARAYYAAEALGVLERIHRPLFDAIHLQHKPLGNEAALVELIASRGVDAAKFRDALHSFAVDAKVRQATETCRSIKLDGVPALVIDGQYLTSPTLTGSREKTLQTVDLLVAQSRQGSRS